VLPIPAFEDELTARPMELAEEALSLPEDRSVPSEQPGEERRRKRRRRRRKDRPADAERAAGAELADSDEDLLEESLEVYEEIASSESITVALSEAAEPISPEDDSQERPRRRRRRRGGRKKERAQLPEGVETDEEDRPADEMPPVAEAVVRLDDAEADADEDGHQEDDGDDDDDKSVKGHRGIPSWDDAVGHIVSANLQSRAKNPVASGPRGRGRGGRGRGRPSGN
jgi:ribonuclease E